jgi:hypothetical protein
MFNKKSLVSKLGGALIGSSLLFMPAAAKADEWADLQFTFGAILNSGVIPTKNCEDAKYLQNLGRLNMHLAMYNNRKGNSSFYTEEVHKIDPTSSMHWTGGGYFCMYNYCKDDNNNKRDDFYNEFKGIDNHTFYAGDSMYLRLDAFDLEGKSAYIRVFTEDGRKVLEDSKNITHRSWAWYKDFKENAKKITDAYGTGNYYAKFHINNGLLGVRFFNLQKRHNIFLCNYYSDDNNDNKPDYPGEFVGFNRKQFFSNEKITIVTRSIDQIGKRVRDEIFDPRGNLVATAENPIKYSNNYSLHFWDPAKELMDKGGPGNYRVKMFVDGEFQGSTEFELKE